MADLGSTGVSVQQNQNERAARVKIADPKDLVKILTFLAAIFLGIGAIQTNPKPPKFQLEILLVYTSVFGLLYLIYVSLPDRAQRYKTNIQILLNANAVAIFYSFQGIFMWQMCLAGPILVAIYIAVVRHYLRDYLANLQN